MSLVQGEQPEIRFNLAGPMGIQGVSFVPKVFTASFAGSQGAGNYDFWVAPAACLIHSVFCVVETALDGTATMDLGTDGNLDAMLDTTDCNPTVLNAMYTNLGGTTNDEKQGTYLAAGDTIRLTIGGTPTLGELKFVFVIYELDAMFARGTHMVIT